MAFLVETGPEVGDSLLELGQLGVGGVDYLVGEYLVRDSLFHLEVHLEEGNLEKDGEVFLQETVVEIGLPPLHYLVLLVSVHPLPILQKRHYFLGTQLHN